MRIRTAVVVLAAAVALALTGCSSSSSDSKAPDEPGITATKAAARTVDAAAIVGQLRAAVPTVSTTVEYTATTDPNGKLGRPHQYTSKVQFADSRIDQAKAKDASNGDKTDIAYGGTVEVFAAEADAKAWVAYVDKIGQAIGGLVTPDYLLRQGRYVIRASHLLTPDQVGQYKAVLAKVS